MTKQMKPDFSTAVTNWVDLPYDTEQFLEVSFTDPLLHEYSAKVVTDTKTDGAPESRLTTVILRFPRMVLGELNTHRVFSRNSASSRARSIKVTLRDVMENPYIPLFTKNKRGMSGEYVTETEHAKATRIWLRSRDSAVANNLRLLLGDMIPWGTTDEDIVANWEQWIDTYQNEVYLTDTPNPGALSIHKQNVNRLLEPYMWHEAVITSSFWDNFLHLRAHEEAQPEIAAPGFLMQEALRVSQPKQQLMHIPFIPTAEVAAVGENDFEKLTELMFQSSFEAAQISYGDKSKQRRTTSTFQKGLWLLESEHMSPFEHAAFGIELLSIFGGSMSGLRSPSRNLEKSWVQFRAVCETPEIHEIARSLSA